MADPGSKSLYAYFPALNGLRGISILLVVLHHLPTNFPYWLAEIQTRSHLGVELFFAISGFLVTRSLYQCHRQSSRSNMSNTVKDFFVRRLSRIIPPYLIVLILIFVLGSLVPSLDDKLDFNREIFWSLPTMVWNYASVGQETMAGVLVPLWSLAVEEQFYLFLVLLFAFGRSRLAPLLVASVIFSIAARYYVEAADSVYVVQKMQNFTHLRLDALVFGSLGWIFYDRFHKIWHHWLWRMGAVASSITALYFFNAGPRIGFASVYLISALGLTPLVLAAASETKTLLIRLLSAKWLQLIGIISYEMYLIHQIVIGAGVKLGLNQWPIAITAFTVILTVAGSYTFHRGFSNPLQMYLRIKFNSPSRDGHLRQLAT